MGRRKGSLNKSTLARLAAQAAASQPALPVAAAPESPAATPPPPAVPGFALSAGPAVHVEAPAPVPQALRATTAFIEYLAPSSEKWRIERGEELLQMFSIDREQLQTWHSAIAPQERAWHLVRLRFGLAPLLAGPGDAAYMVPLSIEQIAERLNGSLAEGEKPITPAEVELEFDAVRAFWVRWQTAHRGSERPETPQIDEISRATVAERDATLRSHGFSEITDENERLFVFSRINDLRDKIEEAEGRTLVQRCIRLELRMQRNDAIIAKLEHEAAKPDEDTDKASNLRKDIAAYNDLGKDLGVQHLALMKAMGATQEQNPTVQKKVAFVDCLGQLIRGIQEYESRGDNTIIDGVFTAAEVKILTTPMSLRPPQYRLDIVMLTRDAMKHENLWNPEYEPPQMDRAMYRRMRKALRDALGAMENEDGAVFEMEEDEIGGSGDSDAERPPSPSDAMNTAAPAAAPAAPLGGYQRPALTGRVRPGDEFTVG
jgi:hypothetical protein